LNNNYEIIKDRVKLLDVVTDDLDLKRNGKVYKAQCPFHSERTPSFTVWPQKQTFHCFGCSRNGTVIDYIMYRENIKEPYEAVEYIADKYNITIQGFDKETIQRKKETVKRNRSEALQYYKNIKKGESFLLDRGFKQETIKKFGIGFSIPHNAVVIPYLDTYGNVVGKTFRNLDEDKPKYVNSAEDEVFKKSELLYGLDKARRHINDKVYIVEGYFDMIAMDQMGYKETVAYCGSSITEGQVTLLSKYINRYTKIFLIPDNDKTGLKNVSRNIKLIKRKLRNPIGVYHLPDGIKDTNDVLKLGISIENDFITSEHHEMFLLRQELDKCLEQTDEYEAAREFVRFTKNEMIRAEMAEYLASRWDKPKNIVYELMKAKSETVDYEADMKTFSQSLSDYKAALLEGSKGRVYFNLNNIDSKVNGMKPGEVAFLMGRSGSGKTTLALNLIYNSIVRQNQNVIFNSLELKGENIVPQLLQIHQRTDQGVIANKVKSDEFDDSDEAFLRHMDRRLRIVDKPGQTVEDIENFAVMANESEFDKPLSLMVIDYFGYIKMTGNDDYAVKSNTARKMKEIAKKLNCVVFVLTQTNRDGGTDGSTPLNLQSARDTGAIEETGDYVYGVYWPAVSSTLSEAEREQIKHEYFIQILKNRWGSLGNIKTRFEAEHKLMTNWRG